MEKTDSTAGMSVNRITTEYAEESDGGPAPEKSREHVINDATAEMIAEGKDLTVKGSPELPALKARVGFNVSKKERNAAFASVLNEMKVEKEAEPHPDWEDPADSPVELPCMLWHPEKEAALARTPGHYNALKARGYFDELDDAASNDPDQKRLIWERERDSMHRQDGTT